MELIKYISCKIKVQLVNSYYYIGLVQDTTTNESLELIDVNGQKVSLSPQAILTIQEVTS